MSRENNANGRAGGSFKEPGPAPGRVEDVRRGNLVRVLAAIAQARTDPQRYPTRAELASLTGLTKASVSSLVAELADSGLVMESGATRDGERGRPGVGLQLSTRRGVVGMEINVDYISAGLLDLGGALRASRTLECGNRGQSPESVMALLSGLVNGVVAEAAAAGIEILGGGLAVPGLVDTASGTVSSAPNLQWHSVALELGGLLPGAPLGTVLYNEANCAALAELWYGHGLDFRDYLFVSGEVGVGGGLVIGSRLFAGPHGQAGEVGHVVVDPSGPDCSCGGRGCLETFAGQEAIFAEAGIPAGTASVRLGQLVEQLDAGNAAATSAVARAGRYLGIAAASTARLMNLSAVVLGGHFTRMGPWLAPAVIESLANHAPGVVSPARVAVSELGQSAALLGAAGSALRSVLAAPSALTPAG
jgi:predicted NBD/HSP70 family sugar kinase